MQILLLLIVSCHLVGSFRLSSIRLRRTQSTVVQNDLLGEQLKELQEGIQEFQQDAFKDLYNKNVSWVKNNGDKDAIISENTEDKSTSAKELTVDVTPSSSIPVTAPVAVVEPPSPVTTPSQVTKESVAPKAVTKEVELEKPVPVAKPVSVPPSIPIVTIAPVAVSFSVPEVKSSSEGIALKSVPIIAKEEPVEAVDEKDLLKAQQAITRSFLSFGNTAFKKETTAEVIIEEPKKVDAVKAEVSSPSPRPAVASPMGGLFGFLKSDPNVDLVAQQKRSSAAPTVAKAFATKPKVEEAVSPAVTTKEAPVVVKAAPVVVKAAPVIVKAAPVVVKAAPVVTKASPVSSDASGGFFGFLSPKSEVVTSKPVSSETKAPAPVIAKAAPVVAKAAPVTTPAPSPKSETTGGFFSFLNPTPVSKPATTTTTAIATKSTPVVVKNAPVIAKPAPVVVKASPVIAKVAPVVAKPAPVIAKAAPVVAKAAPVTTPAPSPKSETTGGFFGFLNPTPVSKPATTTTTAIATKLPPVVVKAVPVVVKTTQAPKSEVSGGFFGFLNPTPVNKPTTTVSTSTTTAIGAKVVAAKAAPVVVKAAPVVAKAAPVTTPASSPKSETTGGFFGFLNPTPVNKPTTTVITKPTPVVVKTAPVVAKPAPVVVKAAPVVVKATPVVAKATPVVAKEASKSEATGGFFSFLNPTPVNKPPITTTTTAITPVSIKPGSRSAPIAKAPIVSVKQAPVVIKAGTSPAPKSEVSGGFFGFLNPTPVSKPTTTVSTSTTTAIGIKSSTSKFQSSVTPKTVVPVKVTPAVPQKAMNQKFQNLVSTSLKNDSNKKILFQQKLDSFRAGASDASSFIKALENIFGESLLDSIVVPLISELPEKVLADKLKAEYAKKKEKK